MYAYTTTTVSKHQQTNCHKLDCVPTAAAASLTASFRATYFKRNSFASRGSASVRLGNQFAGTTARRRMSSILALDSSQDLDLGISSVSTQTDPWDGGYVHAQAKGSRSAFEFRSVMDPGGPVRLVRHRRSE